MVSAIILLVLLIAMLLLLFWQQQQQMLDAINDTITRLSKLNEQAAHQNYKLQVELNVMRCATNRRKHPIEMEEQTQFDVSGTNQQEIEL